METRWLSLLYLKAQSTTQSVPGAATLLKLSCETLSRKFNWQRMANTHALGNDRAYVHLQPLHRHLVCWTMLRLQCSSKGHDRLENSTGGLVSTSWMLTDCRFFVLKGISSKKLSHTHSSVLQNTHLELTTSTFIKVKTFVTATSLLWQRFIGIDHVFQQLKFKSMIIIIPTSQVRRREAIERRSWQNGQTERREGIPLTGKYVRIYRDYNTFKKRDSYSSIKKINKGVLVW